MASTIHRSLYRNANSSALAVDQLQVVVVAVVLDADEHGGASVLLRAPGPMGLEEL
jgi:hypothetical protein